MSRSSHRPAGHPWYPILWGTARIRRAWVSFAHVKRKAIRQARREVGMAFQRRDPLAISPFWVNEFPPYHASAYRAEHRISVATGPGRLP